VVWEREELLLCWSSCLSGEWWEAQCCDCTKSGQMFELC